MTSIEISGLTKRFGSFTAVEDINLKIEPGEYLSIIGPSGCGKTTIIRMIAGILEPDEGKITIDGADIRNIPPYERGVGYVFQNIALFPHMNVLDNIRYSGRVKDWPQSKTDAAAERFLALVNLLDQKGRFSSELSGGTQQKTALARALASETKLLLLDEPLSALDTLERLKIRHELRSLVKALNLTAIHVTHDQEEAMSISDRVVVIKNGKVVEVNTPRNLYNHPKSLFTANFVGESNFLEGTVRSSDGANTVIELNSGAVFTLKGSSLSYGDAAVIANRPENLEIVPAGQNRSGNILEVTVEDAIFVGGYTRYVLHAPGDARLISDIPTTANKSFIKGEKAMAIFSTEKTVAYKKPAEGLAEVVKLE